MVGNQTNLDVKERFATLAWARHAVANSIDPSSWPSMLSTTFFANLSTLYIIPPARTNAPSGDTYLHWLAHEGALNMP